MSDAVLRKVKALLAKTQDNGCTKEEAEAAAIKAQELLDEYNLSYFETEAPVCQEFETDLGTFRQYIGVCAVMFANAFDCKVIRYATTLKWIGLQYDCAIASVMFLQFMSACTQDCTYKGKEKEAFFIEATRALTERMKSLRSSSARGLVVRKDLLIAEHTKDLKLKAGRALRTNSNSSAAEDGRRYGVNYQQKAIK